jgi:hypothetical protein
MVNINGPRKVDPIHRVAHAVGALVGGILTALALFVLTADAAHADVTVKVEERECAAAARIAIGMGQDRDNGIQLKDVLALIEQNRGTYSRAELVDATKALSASVWSGAGVEPEVIGQYVYGACKAGKGQFTLPTDPGV